MINNFNFYEDFANELFAKLPIMKTEQLHLYIKKYFSLDEKSSWEIMLGLQRAGVFMLSKDGWSITKGMYQKLTCDRSNRYTVHDDYYQLDCINEYCSKYKPAVIKAFWLVIDLLPQSNNFVITDSSPYQIMFTVEPEDDVPARLFQICCIEKGYEIITPEVIKSTLTIQDKLTRHYVRRIVLLENKDASWRIPFIGISNICLYDESLPKHYSVIEKRNIEERWKDYECSC